MRTKDITFGELTDKIISNDYHNHPMHLRAPPPPPPNHMSYMQNPQGIIATGLFRRRVEKEEPAAAAVKGGPHSAQQTMNFNSNPGTLNSQGRSTTPGDDRNIIRMPQSHSPRKYMQEFMIAQDYHYQQQQQQQPGAGGPPPTSIKRGTSSYDANSVAGSTSSSHSHLSNMSGGGGGGSYQPTPVTTFAATTYAYPYSALNVPSSVAGLPPTSQMNLNVGHQMPPTSSSGSSMHKQPTHVLHGGGAGCSTGVSGGGHDGNPNSIVSTTSGVGGGSGGPGGGSSTGSSATEPKPLLSAQYEALSDED